MMLNEAAHVILVEDEEANRASLSAEKLIVVNRRMFGAKASATPGAPQAITDTSSGTRRPSSSSPFAIPAILSCLAMTAVALSGPSKIPKAAR